jgi:hypothetical protein
MHPITARAGLVAEAQATLLCSAAPPALSESRDGSRNPDLPDLAAATGLGKCYRHRRLVHIQPDVSDSIHQARLPCMRLCAGHSGTSLDILHVERRAADHSANIEFNTNLPAGIAPSEGRKSTIYGCSCRGAPTASPCLSAIEIAALLGRGDAFLSAGDITSARLFYERAADAGYGLAALQLGATFGSLFLAMPAYIVSPPIRVRL